MTKQRRHLTIMAVWIALLIVAAFVFRDRIFPAGGDAPAPSANLQAGEPTVETRAAPALPRLVGRWRRATGGYILDVKAVGDDGTVDAAYLNPRPIHVSKAQAITQGGFTVLAVTLQVRGYPGNLYTLTYDPDADVLEGVYHHRGLRQQFDVAFARLPPAPDSQE